MDNVSNTRLTRQISGGNKVLDVVLFMFIVVRPLIRLWVDEA